jgi:FkbH-like protein
VTALAVLRDRQSSIANVMNAVAALEAGDREPILRAGISANVTADLLGTYLRRHALLAGGSAVVAQGSLDSHLDNARRFAGDGVEQLLLINFFDALMPAFETRLADLDPALVADQRERLRHELGLVLAQASTMKSVVVALMHRFTAAGSNRRSAAIDAALAGFNEMIESVVAGFRNATTISTGDIVSEIGRTEALNARFYLRALAPYQPRFWDEFARRILLASRGAGTYLYKVLVLDCDNTLWGGVVGEDLVDGIALGPDSYPGNVFWRVQSELLALQRRGVLLCLCTRNNGSDVAEVLERHPHQLIRDQHLIIKKVGWDDKVDSIRAIADELGVGLDSIVFLDDSAFEIESVRERLPAVTTVQVPRNVFEYPAVMQELSDRFLSGRPDDGGAEKTEQYRVRAGAQAEIDRHGGRAEYLASLGLTVELRRDPRDAIPRIAALSQKSNQFNLTTRRYTEAEIADLIDARDVAIYTLRVRDRFGDSGITGIAIVRYDLSVARIESFLISCRVLGRDIELAPWPTIAADASARGCERLEAQWLRTRRNQQVERFYDRLGLAPGEVSDGRRTYTANLADTEFACPAHIAVSHG